MRALDHVGMDRLHVLPAEHLGEADHALLVAKPPAHDRIELGVRRGRGITQVGHHAATHRAVAMAGEATRRIQRLAARHLLRRRAQRRRRECARHRDGLGQLLPAIQRVHQQPAAVHGTRHLRHAPAGERQPAAPADHDRDVLLAVDGICHRRRHHAGLHRRGPQALAGVGAIGHELAARAALEHQLTGRAQHTAVERRALLDAPGFLARHRIPGDQVALHQFQHFGSRRRILGQPGRLDVDARVPQPGLERELVVVLVDEGDFLHRDIDQPGARTEAHRMPVVRAVR